MSRRTATLAAGSARDSPAVLLASAALCGVGWSAVLTWDQWQISSGAALALASFYALVYGLAFAAAGLAAVAAAMILRRGGARWAAAAVFVPIAAVVLGLALYFGSLSGWPTRVALLTGLLAGWLLAFATRRWSPASRGLGPRLPFAAAVLAAAALAVGAWWKGPIGERPDTAELVERSTRPMIARLHVLGFDGVDPDLLERLIEEVPLPAMARLRESAASARVESPYIYSPEIWTSYATGRTREAHGVDGFHSYYLADTSIELPRSDLDFAMLATRRLAPGLRDDRTRSSNSRRVPALWELASEAGLESLVSNWWATYPVVPFAGVMVTPHALPWSDPAKARRFQVREGSVWPAAIARRIREMVGRAHRELAVPGRSRARNAKLAAVEIRDLVAWRAYEDLSTARMALCMVYQEAIDVFSHNLTSEVFGREGSTPRREPTPEEVATAILEQIVPAYVDMDRRVGAVMDRLGGDEALVVVSDHGWRYDGTEHYEGPDGVLFLYGGPFRSGSTLEPVSIFDVFPILATLLGLPLSEELEGSLPAGALEPAAVPGTRTVPSYGPRTFFAAPPRNGSDEDLLEELQGLGYIR